MTVERYPDLKSNQNFLALQNQLESIENRIAVERRRYNETVRAYNTAVRTFPASLVASFRGSARSRSSRPRRERGGAADQVLGMGRTTGGATLS